jgi:hypothetical protein
MNQYLLGLVWQRVRPNPRVVRKPAHDGLNSPVWPRCAFGTTGVGSNPAQNLPTHACPQQLLRTSGEKNTSAPLASPPTPLSLAAPPPPLPSRSLTVTAPPVSLTASGRCASASSSSSYSSSVSSPNSSSPSLFFYC